MAYNYLGELGADDLPVPEISSSSFPGLDGSSGTPTTAVSTAMDMSAPFQHHSTPYVRRSNSLLARAHVGVLVR
jgi:hypothetical protein